MKIILTLDDGSTKEFIEVVEVSTPEIAPIVEDVITLPEDTTKVPVEDVVNQVDSVDSVASTYSEQIIG